MSKSNGMPQPSQQGASRKAIFDQPAGVSPGEETLDPASKAW
jgi:hypothetical protein